MSKTFKPRYPTRTAPFWFTGVNLLLSYVIGALVVIGLMNNSQNGAEFNLIGAIIVFLVAGVLLAISLFLLLKILKTHPKQVIIEDDRLLVQDASGQPFKLETEIPFAALTQVHAVDVPVEGSPFKASFEGLAFYWQPNPDPALVTDTTNVANPDEMPKTPEQKYILSSRNVCDFEELRNQIFSHVPKEARTGRNYR